MYLNNNIDFLLLREDLLKVFSEIISQLKSIRKKKDINFNIITDYNSNNSLTVFDNISLDEYINMDVVINNHLFIIGEPSNKATTILVNSYINYEIIKEPISLLALFNKFKNFINQKNDFLSKLQKFKQFNYSSQLNTIYVKENSLYLTDKENEIFQILLENQNTSLNKKNLLSKVWNYSTDIDTHTLETHIYTLRQKINKKLKLKNIITHENDGYRINIII